jgi:uncharacterized SAM-dependent methyltransferase
MNIIRNIDVSREYGVSPTAVTNWITSSVQGRNQLQLTEKDGKMYILDTPNNRLMMEQLSRKGKIFKAKDSRKKTTVNPKFYKNFKQEEIVEIAHDLELYKEINHKFSYVGGGAQFWDDYYTKSYQDGSYKTPERDIRLLDENYDMILSKIPKRFGVNVIDLGAGNAQPLKKLLTKLSRANKLISYTPVDISKEMIDIAVENVSEWFPGIKINSYDYDIERCRLDNILSHIKAESSTESINLIFNLGSTIGNHLDRFSVLKNIQKGMGLDDLFILSNSLDSDKNKVAFSFLKQSDVLSLNTWIPKYLGFDVDQCEHVMKYVPEENCRVQTVQLDKDYEVEIEVNGKKVFLNFYKGNEIVVWRHYMTQTNTLFQEFKKCGLELVSYNTENDLSHALMICKVNKDKPSMY